MPRGPVTDEERARIVELHAAGYSRNKIAEDMDRPPSTITRLARELGLAFDRSQVKEANEARKVDLAAMRAEQALGLLEDVAKIRRMMWTPGQKVAGSGKKVDLDRVDARDLQAWMTATGIALQRSLELSRFDADPNEGGAAVDAWLAHMTGEDA